MLLQLEYIILFYNLLILKLDLTSLENSTLEILKIKLNLILLINEYI